MSGVRSGSGSCGTSVVEDPSASFLMCGVRRQVRRPIRRFHLAPGDYGSRPCLHCGAGRTQNWTTRPRTRSRIRPTIRKWWCRRRIPVKRCESARHRFRRNTGNRRPRLLPQKSVEVAESSAFPEHREDAPVLCAQEIGRAAQDSRHRARLAMMAGEQENAGSSASDVEICSWHAAGTLNARDAPRRGSARPRSGTASSTP